MTEAEIRAAFADVSTPADNGFSDLVARRVTGRRRWRIALFVVMAAAALACFALLFAGFGQMASLWLGGMQDGLAGGAPGLAPLAIFLVVAIVVAPLAGREA